jgi:hypothetical protein
MHVSTADALAETAGGCITRSRSLADMRGLQAKSPAMHRNVSLGADACQHSRCACRDCWRMHHTTTILGRHARPANKQPSHAPVMCDEVQMHVSTADALAETASGCITRPRSLADVRGLQAIQLVALPIHKRNQNNSLLLTKVHGQRPCALL